MNKRRAVKEMMDHVEAGDAYAIKSNGEPVAMVVPWEHYESLKRALEEKTGAPS